MELRELGERANITHKTVRIADGQAKSVIVYEDHRYLLNIIDHARRCGVLPTKTGLTLVMFDHHDDAKPTSVPSTKLKAMRNSWPSQRDFWSFVEWELSGNDDDWVIVGMELGLLENVLLLGAETDHNIRRITHDEDSGLYTDSSGQPHLVASLGHLWDGLAHQGWLNDGARARELKPIWDVLGWEKGELGPRPSVPVLVDFCLDCFTGGGPPDRPTRPWSMADFFEPFERSFGGSTSQDVLAELVAASPFVAIARESPYCGGFGGSDEILRYLDQLLFGEMIRPSSYGR